MLHLLHQISPLTFTAIQSLEPDCELRLGDQSAEVQDLQLILKELGFYQGALDSEFQPATERALLHLQQQLEVQATGQLDIETWYAITYWAEEQTLAQPIAA
jgi:peptidoglycan hydrolase-like protein with peptidoglycan-binding domain